jgi:hypothetical protein
MESSILPWTSESAPPRSPSARTLTDMAPINGSILEVGRYRTAGCPSPSRHRSIHRAQRSRGRAVQIAEIQVRRTARVQPRVTVTGFDFKPEVCREPITNAGKAGVVWPVGPEGQPVGLLKGGGANIASIADVRWPPRFKARTSREPARRPPKPRTPRPAPPSQGLSSSFLFPFVGVGDGRRRAISFFCVSPDRAAPIAPRVQYDSSN